MDGKTILVVDDDRDLRDAVVGSLGFHGYRTIAASNGAEALAIVSSTLAVDLILLDIIMPVMDGWSFARALLAIPHRTLTPVLGFSASIDLPDCPIAPFVSFLRKPVRTEVLLRAVSASIRE